MRGIVITIAAIVALMAFAAAAHSAEAPAPPSPVPAPVPAPVTPSAAAIPLALDPGTLLARAAEATSGAGNIRATLKLEVTYPARYEAVIALYAAPGGDERADITATVAGREERRVEVITSGVMWTEDHGEGGPVVTRTDINRVRAVLAQRRSPAVPALGTNALYDLDNLTWFINFDSASPETVDGRSVYAVSGSLDPAAARRRGALPAGAERWYRKAVVYLDAGDFFPYRIELGDEDGQPAMRLTFSEVARNAPMPEGIFIYSPPPGVTVIDRTDWAIAEFSNRD